MKPFIVALVAGLLFGAGLIVGGMTDPGRVVGFLDISGAWNPALAFVMVGAIAVHAVLRRFVAKRSHPLFHETFSLPTKNDIDRDLLLGSALFGIGWGLSGYCPGPALVSAGSGSLTAIAFVAAMGVGMWIQQRPR
jgi:uncharacterized membrane protein YedE/YeeE